VLTCPPQAIERKGTSDVKDWAEYWVVLSTFYVTQWAIDFVLCWLPFYYIAKLGFIMALWHPSTRLAQSLYQKVLSPLAITYEADIDRLHQDVRTKAAGGWCSLFRKLINVCHGWRLCWGEGGWVQVDRLCVRGV
jgi:hypothetical protein